MVYDAMESCDEESSTQLKLKNQTRVRYSPPVFIGDYCKPCSLPNSIRSPGLKGLAQILEQMPRQQSFFGTLLKQCHPRFLCTDKAFVEHFNTLANANSNGTNMSKSVRSAALQTLCTAYHYLHQCHHWESICFTNLYREWPWISVQFSDTMRLQELLGQWQVRNYYAILALEKKLQENDVQVGGPEPDSPVDVLLEQLNREHRECLQKRRQKRNKGIRKKRAKDDDGNSRVASEPPLIPF